LPAWATSRAGTTTSPRELHVIKGTAFISIERRRSGNPTEPIIAVMKQALAKLK
jgi:hypothetical protein